MPTATDGMAGSADRIRRRRISGLYVLTPEDSDTGRLLARVAAALAGGARAVQYRSKSAPEALRLEQASALVRLCAQRGVPLIVNDRPDLAARVGAAGVHVGSTDASLAQARACIGAEAIVGVSCYADFEHAQRAVDSGADYIAFGSFHPSPTKPEAVRADPALIRRARESWDVPVVAIGGITAENAGALIDAGVDAVAVITAVFDAADVEAAARAIASQFETAGNRR